MTEPTPPPVPAPVDVEAVVDRIKTKLCLLLQQSPTSIGGRFIGGAVNEAVQAGLAARSAPVDAALLAQCREALEAAERALVYVNWGSRDGDELDRVRAALARFKASS